MTEQEQRNAVIRLAGCVMGWTVQREGGCIWAHDDTDYGDHSVRITRKLTDSGMFVDRWDPFTSIADAWMLLDALAARGYVYSIDRVAPAQATHAVWLSNGGKGTRVEGADAPQAICMAALATLEQEAQS